MIQKFRLVITSLIFLGFSSTTLAEVPTDFEPQYAEAILAFNGRDYDQALKLLKQLEKQSPDVPEFLELKALTLKVMNKPASSAKAYRQLIDKKKREKASLKEIAPYYFELGVLYFNKKKFKGARKYFNLASKGKFNVGPTYFFLGMIGFQESNWAFAIQNFKKVTESDADDLKPASYFYLAQTYFKIKYINGATDYLLAAKSHAKDAMNDKKKGESIRKVSKSIYNAAIKALKPLNKSRWFGNLSLISGYDTNILSLPDDSSISSATSLASFKQVMQFGIGRMGSPTSSIQLVPSYRLSTNWNLNDQARAYEYSSNRFSLYFTKHPLSLFSYGLKTEGNFTFANGSDTGRFSYAYFSTTAELGPFFKKELGQGKYIGGEFFWGPAIYADDSKTTKLSRKNGSEFSSKLFYQNDIGKRYWNPTFSFNMGYTIAEGSNNQNYEMGMSLSDLMYLSKRLKLAGKISFSRTTYPSKLPEARTDHEIKLSALTTYRWKPKWTVLGELSYENNTSSIPAIYSYSKFSLTLGMSYRLF